MKKLLFLCASAFLVLGACGNSGESKDDSTEETKEEAKTDDTSNNKEETNSDDSKDDAKDDSKSEDDDDSITAKKDDDKEKSDVTFKNNQFKSEEFDLKIEEVKLTESEYDGEQVAIFYSVTNKDAEDELSPMTAFMRAFEVVEDQKDVENRLDISHFDTETEEKYNKYTKNESNNIKKGGTAKGVAVYKLEDIEGPILLKAQDIENYGDSVGQKKINIKEVSK
ncbi:DUF5067 domain-containing protein [Staphylococcus massiliensis]|uniref:DUF5067 domain-containing protein n=1 Tax=Staphylococcus massiliensis S46 TaxID=1229783 RepID=K9ARV5_9STAP|nr:DUF5067 domain-containing protein [Staphylococcus massiliensis]EKU50019.1 hypothetical protein C273_02083 [Staphylococcus massiliensis S46]MCG3399221.1 DUF5067 domain-containing protein [Staphylococcus massiliensis]MCG3402274.1 DUF5067 domain-containing protein [Staphylococcus massiliensis]MCG3413415.1 DUF5067 domain-containing protein [Staphylococcus massiliensis]PNZ97695.1 DUF5067 domain-containing protein [Staphylococcus massiliensis CCUG 55927]